METLIGRSKLGVVSAIWELQTIPVNLNKIKDFAALNHVGQINRQWSP